MLSVEQSVKCLSDDKKYSLLKVQARIIRFLKEKKKVLTVQTIDSQHKICNESRSGISVSNIFINYSYLANTK
jgi:hypothetical protein